MIKVAHLTKEYGDHIAAKDISFEIPSGTICGFLGPNGAGKSTTMNMITGYIAPNKGSVLINDISMQKSPVKAKKMIGYLPEIPPVYPDMTVFEYLRFVCELKGIRKFQINDEVKRISDACSLGQVSDRLIKNLSKGYKQRVGLAGALAGDPDILVLDEPTVGLDPKQIVEIRNLIKKLGENHTVILSTHILSEVSAVCDKIIVISHGRVMADDNPTKLEERFNEVQSFVLVVKGNASRVENVLASIENIDDYKMLEESSDQVKFLINAKRFTDIRESVSESIMNAGLTLLELNVNHISLEDIYLKLTGEEYYKEILEKEGVSTKEVIEEGFDEDFGENADDEDEIEDVE